MDGVALDHAMDTRELVGGAILLSSLLFLWGALSLLFVPAHPFGVPNTLQTIVGATALVYFLATRVRPNERAARWFSVGAIVYALAILPWVAIAWTGLGRPMDALTVPHVGAVTVPLAFPRSFWLRVGLVVLFTAEALFVSVWATHAGAAARLPIAAPMISVYYAFLGVALAVVRERRRQVALRYIRVEAELGALRKVAPRFADVRRELEHALGSVRDAFARVDQAGATRSAPRMTRAMDRLDAVGGQLEELLRAPCKVHARHPTAQQLLDRDAHFGATVFSGLFAVIGTEAALYARPIPALPLALLAGVAAILFAWLLATRRRPSEVGALGAVVILWAMAMAIAIGLQPVFLTFQRPFIPMLGPKMLVLLLGIVAVSRVWLGAALIVVTTAAALVLFYVTGMHHHRDLVALSEPWVILAFATIGVATLVMRNQRRIRSERLQRAEAEARALHRRAAMYLALRDRLNSPLQTLVAGAAQLGGQARPETEGLRSAVGSLVTLSRQLAAVDRLVPPESARLSMDAEYELRSHL